MRISKHWGIFRQRKYEQNKKEKAPKQELKEKTKRAKKNKVRGRKEVRPLNKVS